MDPDDLIFPGLSHLHYFVLWSWIDRVSCAVKTSWKRLWPTKFECRFCLFYRILLANKNRKLKKGTGFNIDLLLGAIMMTINSFFGLPWLCAAPVRTLAHWSSLTTYSRSHIPGEKQKLILVREQRITGVIVHVAIGKFVFCLLNDIWSGHMFTKTGHMFTKKLST